MLFELEIALCAFCNFHRTILYTGAADRPGAVATRAAPPGAPRGRGHLQQLRPAAHRHAGADSAPRYRDAGPGEITHRVHQGAFIATHIVVLFR